MLRIAIALSLTCATVPAHAEISKCVDPAGKVEYRNSACPSEPVNALPPAPAEKQR